MFQIISEWATIYFKVGACIGFGFGSISQILQGKSRNWTLTTILVLTCFWPFIMWDVAFGKRNK